MLGRAGGQPKVFAQRRRRAKSHGRFHDDAAASRPYRSPIASATLVQVAKSMDARNIRARRTAVITDLLPDTFLGLLLGNAEALCAVLSPPQEYIMPALGPEAMRPRALRRTARSMALGGHFFSIACSVSGIHYSRANPARVCRRNSGLGLWMSLRLASQISDRP